MTGLVSNQMLLKIIKISLKSDNLEEETVQMMEKELEFEDFTQFLLLLRRPIEFEIKAVNYLDREYPQRLRTIYNPPALLFFEGNIDLLKTECVGIIGSRKATNYSFRCISALVPHLVNRYTIVSGLAEGADSMANEEALVYGKTIAVLGSSLEQAFPVKNRYLQQAIAKNGLLITEYPIGNRIEPWHFPQRNRIIAGLSQKLIVTEAKERSGSMITVDLALENGREVYALPGPFDSELSRGCNSLIKQGATPLIDFENL